MGADFTLQSSLKQDKQGHQEELKRFDKSSATKGSGYTTCGGQASEEDKECKNTQPLVMAARSFCFCQKSCPAESGSCACLIHIGSMFSDDVIETAVMTSEGCSRESPRAHTTDPWDGMVSENQVSTILPFRNENESRIVCAMVDHMGLG